LTGYGAQIQIQPSTACAGDDSLRLHRSEAARPRTRPDEGGWLRASLFDVPIQPAVSQTWPAVL